MIVRPSPHSLLLPLLAVFLVAGSWPGVPSARADEESEEPDERTEELKSLDELPGADRMVEVHMKQQPLRFVFDAIGGGAGVPIAYGDDFPADETATVNFSEVPLAEVFRRLARQFDLRYTIREDGTLLVDGRP